jgi:hypothetical protein
MASPERPYRFPALPDKDEPVTRCTSQSCATCSASALASCVALCFCPCALLSCFTLTLAKAPYMAGWRAWSGSRGTGTGCGRRGVSGTWTTTSACRAGELIKALPRRSSREWGELTRAASVGAEGRARVMSSRSSDFIHSLHMCPLSREFPSHFIYSLHICFRNQGHGHLIYHGIRHASID